ncbi:AAA family ATPase [Actinokineospora sp. 24-640]
MDLVPFPSVITLIGPSGAGKSSLAARWSAAVPELAVLSYDTVQHDLTGDWRTVTPAAVDQVHELLRARCAAGLGSIVDGTHVQPDRRAAVRAIAAQHGLPAVAVVLRVSLATCLRRQQDRARRAPGDDIRAQFEALAPQLPRLLSEPYAVLVIRHQDAETSHPTGSDDRQNPH